MPSASSSTVSNHDRDSATTDAVRRYFDANTRLFERLGQGGSSIHRAVWAPGVTTRQEAFAYVDSLIAHEIAQRMTRGKSARVLDLGCGVGASLIRLASSLDLEGVGVTLSPVQAARGSALIAAHGLSDRLRCIEQSFTDMPDSLGLFDAAYAIESFVLSPSPEVFFEQAARRLRPGGVLIVCDDLLSERDGQSPHPDAKRWIEEIRYGWLMQSLVTEEQAIEAAARTGLTFVRSDDLTAYLELRRPRDLAITAALALGRRANIKGELWRSWIGGNALQLSLINRIVTHRVMVFEFRQAPDTR